MTLPDFLNAYSELLVVLGIAAFGGVKALAQRRKKAEEQRTLQLENELKEEKLKNEQRYRKERIRKEEDLHRTLIDLTTDIENMSRSVDNLTKETVAKIDVEVSKLRKETNDVFRTVGENDQRNGILLDGIVDILDTIKSEKLLTDDEAGKKIEEKISRINDVKARHDYEAQKKLFVYGIKDDEDGSCN